MLLKRGKTHSSKQQVCFFLSLWYRRNPHSLKKKDIFAKKVWDSSYRSTPQKKICRAITCGEIKSDDGGDEEAYEVDNYDNQPVEAKPAPEELEDGGQTATMNELKEVNLGTEEDPRPTFISSLLLEEQIEEIIKLLCEFRDCFAWTFAEMPGLSPNMAVHRLAIKSDTAHIKQAPRRMRLEIEEQVIT